VVVDLLMPDLGGLELLARLRDTAAGRAAAFLVWTVKDVTAEERARLRAMDAEVVTKGAGGARPLVEALLELFGRPSLDGGAAWPANRS
jgi:CheY-like chemotaxis protein